MNIDTIIGSLSRPLPYEPSARSIWTDPWISKRLLEAHLDPSTDAASRAPAQRARALSWIEELLMRHRPAARAGAEGEPLSGCRVLDLGCGPGLYSEALALKGCAITGIDFSVSSIAYARSQAEAKGLAIEYRLGDYLVDELGRGYDLAMMIYCDFGVFSPEKAGRLLDRARGALAEGGYLVFDVVGPGYAKVASQYRKWHCSEGVGFFSPRPHVVLEEGFVYPEDRCVARQSLVLVEGEEPALYRNWDHWYEEGELEALLAEHGFRTERMRGDLVAPNDFGPSEVIFVAAVKAG